MTSVLNVDTIADKAGTGPVGLTKQHAAKMWIQATSASSVSTQGSFNVSSLTDVNAGALFPNATNSFANDDYSKNFFGLRNDDGRMTRACDA